MIFIENNSHDAAYNLALEEYLLTNYRNGDIVMLWINSPSVITGKFQNIYEEVSLLECRKRKVGVFRRNSGGGTVYHDGGNLNYTIITNRTSGTSYESFLAPLVSGLCSLGVPADIRGNAIFAGERKISGNAQSNMHGRVMHHGTLLFDTDLGMLGTLTGHARQKIKSKAIKSQPSPVCNISEYITELAMEGFTSAVKGFLCEDKTVTHTLNAEEAAQVESLADKKYRTRGWIYGSSPAFDVNTNEKYGIKMHVSHGIIDSASADAKDVRNAIAVLAGLEMMPEMLYASLSHTLPRDDADRIISEIFD